MYNIGDILKVIRLNGIYYHYGVYVGDDMVVHYTGETKDKRHARIKKTSLSEFSEGNKVSVDRSMRPIFSGQEVAERALGRIDDGENSYNLIFDNCEHFANWCRTGNHVSTQVKKTTRKVIASIMGGPEGILALFSGYAIKVCKNYLGSLIKCVKY